MATATGPGSRSSDSNDKANFFDYSRTDFEHSATFSTSSSDNEEAYNTDND